MLLSPAAYLTGRAAGTRATLGERSNLVCLSAAEKVTFRTLFRDIPFGVSPCTPTERGTECLCAPQGKGKNFVSIYRQGYVGSTERLFQRRYAPSRRRQHTLVLLLLLAGAIKEPAAIVCCHEIMVKVSQAAAYAPHLTASRIKFTV